MNYLDVTVLEGLKEILGDDLLDITHQFASSAENDARAVLACYQGGDMALLARQAHALKGGSANMGGAEMARICAAIEQLAKSGDLAAIGPLAQSLPDVTTRTLAALKDAGYLGRPAG